jgi:hypothetical protein
VQNKRRSAGVGGGILRRRAGRAADEVAEKFRCSISTVYHARKVLKNSSPELVEALCNGDILVKTVYKRLKEELAAARESLGQAV